MSLAKLTQAALATTTIVLIASLSSPEADAYEVGFCEATSHQLYFVDEAGRSGYYSAGGPCFIF